MSDPGRKLPWTREPYSTAFPPYPNRPSTLDAGDGGVSGCFQLIQLGEFGINGTGQMLANAGDEGAQFGMQGLVGGGRGICCGLNMAGYDG